MKKLSIIAMLLVLTSGAAPVFAWSANETDLANTGYSPEMVRLVNLQRSRMEYMEAIKPERSRPAQFMWNILHNDYLGNTYEFGQQVIKY